MTNDGHVPTGQEMRNGRYLTHEELLNRAMERISPKTGLEKHWEAEDEFAVRISEEDKIRIHAMGAQWE